MVYDGTSVINCAPGCRDTLLLKLITGVWVRFPEYPSDNYILVFAIRSRFVEYYCKDGGARLWKKFPAREFLWPSSSLNTLNEGTTAVVKEELSCLCRTVNDRTMMEYVFEDCFLDMLWHAIQRCSVHPFASSGSQQVRGEIEGCIGSRGGLSCWLQCAPRWIRHSDLIIASILEYYQYRSAWVENLARRTWGSAFGRTCQYNQGTPAPVIALAKDWMLLLRALVDKAVPLGQLLFAVLK